MSGVLVWITGLPSSGKSTLARGVSERLRDAGIGSALLDGDAVRAALVPGPGYSERERGDFYSTLSNLAALLVQQGLVVLVAATAHRREFRQHARRSVERFIEVWVDVSAEECRRRDSKGLYRAVADGSAQSLPGADAAYEAPSAPDVIATGGRDSEACEKIVALVVRGPSRAPE